MNELLTMGPNSTTTPPELLIFGGWPAFLFGGGRFSGLIGSFRGRPGPYKVFDAKYDFFHLRVAAFTFPSHVCS
jgi:hypothetical protein